MFESDKEVSKRREQIVPEGNCLKVDPWMIAGGRKLLSRFLNVFESTIKSDRKQTVP